MHTCMHMYATCDIVLRAALLEQIADYVNYYSKNVFEIYFTHVLKKKVLPQNDPLYLAA